MNFQNRNFKPKYFKNSIEGSIISNFYFNVYSIKILEWCKNVLLKFFKLELSSFQCLFIKRYRKPNYIEK